MFYWNSKPFDMLRNLYLCRFCRLPLISFLSLLTCNLCTVINKNSRPSWSLSLLQRNSCCCCCCFFFTFSLRFLCRSKNQNEPSALAVFCTLMKHTITANQSARYILVWLKDIKTKHLVLMHWKKTNRFYLSSLPFSWLPY